MINVVAAVHLLCICQYLYLVVILRSGTSAAEDALLMVEALQKVGAEDHTGELVIFSTCVTAGVLNRSMFLCFILCYS